MHELSYQTEVGIRKIAAYIFRSISPYPLTRVLNWNYMLVIYM